MAFKIKDGVRIGTVDVFNNAGGLLVAAPSVANSLTAGAGLTGGPYNGSGAVTLAHSNTVTASTASEGGVTRTLTAGGTFNIPSVTYDANGHITGKGSITLTLPTAGAAPNNGALTLGIGTAAATNTTVTIGTGTGFSADTASNLTYDIKVGPALTALATLMTTAGAGFIRRGATADTYTIDTSTYLTANQNISVTGDATGSGTTAITLTLANSGVTAGTYNNVTVNAKGLVTGGSNVAYLTSLTDTLQTVTSRGATSSVATISLTGGTASTNTGTGTLVVTGGVGVSGALNVGGATNIGGTLTVTGDLVVNGTTTTVNSTTITVDDKNLELGSVASPTDAGADGGGITLKGTTDKTFNWVNATNSWTSSVALSAPTLVSTVATGTAPLTVTSTTLVTNLNADLLDGNHASAFALASSVNNGTFAVSVGTAGATNTTVTWGTSTGFSANTASNLTYDIKVGPALTALATLMTTAGAGFIKRGATADTYTIDTNTYLTSYTETDTLATVTGRGATTATAITLTNATNATSTSTGALVVTGGVAVGADLVLKGMLVDTNSAGTIISARDTVQATVATTTTTATDSWAIATYRAVKYLVQITQGSNYQISEIMVLHNGTTTTMTEYAVLESGSSLGTFTSDISGGNARLLVTMGAATSATINIQRTLMVV
jgi:hypothetical protein